MIIDETKNLIIREFEQADIQGAVELFSLFDEDTGINYTEETIQAYIKVAYGFYGYGYYGLFDKKQGKLIGIAGFREGSCPLEIGYAIKEGERGKGYAGEAVKSLLEFAEEDFLWVLSEEPMGEFVTGEKLYTYEKDGKVLVYGRTKENNLASQRVLLNNGFKESKGFEK